jgi:hypothetical protein
MTNQYVRCLTKEAIRGALRVDESLTGEVIHRRGRICTDVSTYINNIPYFPT